MASSDDDTDNNARPPPDADDDAEIERIAKRIESNEFPEVTPCNEEDSTELQEWITTVDHVKAQAYIDKKYEEYIAEAGDARLRSDISESEIRARWARDNFYTHLRHFRASDAATCDEVTQAYHAVAPLDLHSASDREHLPTLLQAIGDTSSTPMVQHLEQKWTTYLDSLSTEARKYAEVVKSQWLAGHGVGLLREFLASKTSFKFDPALKLSELPEGRERDRAQKLYAEVQVHHVAPIENKVREGVQMKRASMNVPDMVWGQCEPAVRFEFLRHEYLAIIENVLRDAKPFVFQPAVTPESLEDDDERQRAKKILQQVREQHMPIIETHLKSRWEQFSHSFLGYLQPEQQEATYQDWLRKNYFTELQAVCDRPVEDIARDTESSTIFLPPAVTSLSGRLPSLPTFWGPQTSGPVRNQEPAPRTPTPVTPGRKRSAAAAMLESPLARRSGESRNTVKKLPAYTTTSSVLLNTPSRDDCHILEAFVLWWPDNVRWAKVHDRKSNKTEQVEVCTILLADREGPVWLELWRRSATDFLKQVTAWSKDAQAAGNGHVLIEVKYFWIRKELRKTIRPMYKMVASDQSEFRCLTQGTQASVTLLDEEVPPVYDTIVSDLSELQVTPTWLANVAGVVAGRGEPMQSRNGYEMMSFELHDGNGNCITCTTLGRHVDNQWLADGNEVVLFCVQAMSSNSVNQSSQVWLYDDGHVVLLREGCAIPPTTNHVTFQPPL